MRRAIVIALAAAVAVTVTASAAAGDKARPIAVIVARDAKLGSISKSDLRRCFAGDVVDAGGRRLMPFNFAPGSAERTTFDRVVLAMSPDDAGRYWIDRKVRGQSPAPRALSSAALVVKVVAKFPGAIGYVPLDQVTGDVKVIAIDGARPGDATYPIQMRAP